MNSHIMMRRIFSLMALTFTLTALAFGGQQESAPVQITNQDLLAGLKNPLRGGSRFPAINSRAAA